MHDGSMNNQQMNRVVSPNSSAAMKQLNQNQQQQQQQHQQHTSSPTPTLAFTPTSVLRKMTAEKDMDSSTNTINTANNANKDLNKVIMSDFRRNFSIWNVNYSNVIRLYCISSSNSKSFRRPTFSVGNQTFTFMECRECQFRACKQCKGSACKDYRKINSYQFNQITHSSSSNSNSNFWRNKKVLQIVYGSNAIPPASSIMVTFKFAFHFIRSTNCQRQWCIESIRCK